MAPERNTYVFGRLNFKIGQLSKLAATYKYKDKSRENQGVKGFNLPDRAAAKLDQENEAKVFYNSIPGGIVNEFRASFRHRNQSSIGSTTSLPQSCLEHLIQAEHRWSNASATHLYFLKISRR